ncbi:hypothetical protein F5883DRAFT_686930 [Diaporthe sp. PMI_573]|nr:hypothetical protein F5883DRAFT_686930 [Diaporthaceae sp. PMI_573]
MLPNPLMDNQVKEDHQEIQQLASLFVSNCQPEPYDNWDERWTTQLDPRLQQCDSPDSGIYYIWVTMHIASGLKVPPSFDSRLVRSFVYAICTVINHVAIAAVAPGSGGTEATPGATYRNGETLETLWNVFSSTDLIKGYKQEALSKAFEPIQNAVDAAAFADNNSYGMFLRAIADSYRNTRVSELEQLEAFGNQLAVLTTELLCASNNVDPGYLKRLDEYEASLRGIEQHSTSLRRAHMKYQVKQELGYIAEQKRKYIKSRWLQEALTLVDVPGTADRLN